MGVRGSERTAVSGRAQLKINVLLSIFKKIT